VTEAAPSARPDLDAFDQLLDTPPAESHGAGGAGATQGAESARKGPERDEHLIHETASVGASPTLSQFADGFGLYWDPIACAVLAGAGLGALGVFVVLRRAVFVTATLSQAAGLGVVLAFFLEIQCGLSLPPLSCALAASLACAFLVGVRPRRVSRETVVAFVYLATSALVVLLGAKIAQEAHDVSAILFGTAVLVRPEEVTWVLLGTLSAAALLLVVTRPLLFAGFDRDGARVQGVPVERLELAFWGVFALEVSVATRALGALPVFAFSVLPATAGLLCARRLPGVMAIAVAAGALSGALGYLCAFLLELPVGASQAALAAVLVALAWIVRRVRD
jgi:zinc transport system permease protein